MSFFSSLWVWLGSNAGQVQILIAVIALLLAIIPIRHAYKQFRLSNDQRAFELRTNLMKLIYEAILESQRTLEKYPKVIDLYISMEKNLQDMDANKKALEVRKIITNLIYQKKDLLNQIHLLYSFSEKITNQVDLKVADLEQELKKISIVIINSSIVAANLFSREDSVSNFKDGMEL
ncbi:hypothetical protein IC800_11985 [Acinetobacter seifertii]|uniref:hypothetical protein n=1 Tax=Acinetobacter seifertii TaxID=1530123 RepID=UPI00168CF468|nr:hypothetical protein [Acinetobacter seifertii]QNW93757.1 hypothetical protein IC800_11985 [Acinetobacter seifertii]QNX00841.1 hypothetical protein IC798_12405 [Acinetobacter seifertii]